jgi:hypothetical protein
MPRLVFQADYNLTYLYYLRGNRHCKLRARARLPADSLPCSSFATWISPTSIWAEPIGGGGPIRSAPPNSSADGDGMRARGTILNRPARNARPSARWSFNQASSAGGPWAEIAGGLYQAILQ